MGVSCPKRGVVKNVFTPRAKSPEGYCYHGCGRSVGRRRADFPLFPFFFVMAFPIDAKIRTWTNLTAVSVIVQPVTAAFGELMSLSPMLSHSDNSKRGALEQASQSMLDKPEGVLVLMRDQRECKCK